MADCFQPWVDNFNTCSSVLDGLRIPGVQTPENAETRAIICSKPECQRLFTVFRELIASKCERALREVTRFPNGMFQPTYCPSTQTPGTATKAPGPDTYLNTSTPSPTTKSPSPPTPAPTSKTPKPTMQVPVPSPNASTEEEAAVPVVMTLLPTPAVSTQPPLLAPITQAQATSKSGTSTTTIAAASIGGLVAIVVLVLIVFNMRRKRGNKLSGPVSTRSNEGFVPQ